MTLAVQAAAPPRGRQVGEALEILREFLALHGVEEAPILAEHVLGAVLGCRRLDLGARHAARFSARQWEWAQAWAGRLAAGEPLQYVEGFVEFRGHRLPVDRRALIPRPETEVLVQVVLDTADAWRAARPVVLDVGTGSGCMAISLALERPRGRYVASDISTAALSLARRNARALGLDGAVQFLGADLLAGLAGNSLDIIVANLPYVTTGQMAALPRHIREHEPSLALDGGPDGLRLVTRLVDQAAPRLRDGGFLFLEIDPAQQGAVREALTAAGFTDLFTAADLAGRQRVAGGRLPSTRSP